MYFRFDKTMTDEEYINFNIFISRNTEEGRLQHKHILLVRALTSFLMCLIVFSLSASLALTVFMFVILSVFFAVCAVRQDSFTRNNVKRSMKMYEKSGKKLYTPYAVMEFTDESFIETAEGIRTEVLYSVVKSVKIKNGDCIYIDVNKRGYYTLPFKAFRSNEECNIFIDFLRTRVANVEFC
jgi:hypothetical protein